MTSFLKPSQVLELPEWCAKDPNSLYYGGRHEMMSRMASHGNRIVIQLKMGAKSYPDADSFNTVWRSLGSKYPEQVRWTVWEQDVVVKFQFLETV